MGGILSALAGGVAEKIIDGVLGRIAGVLTAYFQKQISMEELRTKAVAALLETLREIDKANAEALAKTYSSFMGAVAQNVFMQKVWATVVLVQLAVLVYAQVGIPIAAKLFGAWPSSGATIDWAYALIVLLCGGGPLLLQRKVPDLKTLIQK